MDSVAAELVPTFPPVSLVPCGLWAGGHLLLAGLAGRSCLRPIHSLGAAWTVTGGHSR